MKVLRLGNSNDVNPAIGEGSKAFDVAGAFLEEALGEPVETISKVIWPSPAMPGKVAEWLAEYQPDLVFMKVSWPWYGYESVPRRIERIFGRVGKPIARAGLNASRQPRYVSKRWFKAGRRVAHRVIGGDTQWDTKDVVTVCEMTIRTIVAREDIALVVKGTAGGRTNQGPLKGQFKRFDNRRKFVEGNIERLCDELHVHYVGLVPSGLSEAERDLKGGDGVHHGERGLAMMGAKEGQAMLDGWRAFTRADEALATG